MKTIRTWVYALVRYQDKIVVIKKNRGPFTWLYDLPWWKIEHWEKHLDALNRELYEELWLKNNDYIINKMLTIEEDYVKHIWKWQEKDEHIIAIVYDVTLTKLDFDQNYLENAWDSWWIFLLSKNDKNVKLTNILKKVLDKYEKQNI